MRWTRCFSRGWRVWEKVRLGFGAPENQEGVSQGRSQSPRPRPRTHCVVSRGILAWIGVIFSICPLTCVFHLSPRACTLSPRLWTPEAGPQLPCSPVVSSSPCVACSRHPTIRRFSRVKRLRLGKARAGKGSNPSTDAQCRDSNLDGSHSKAVILTPLLASKPGTGQGQLTLAELTVVEVPWLPVDEPVSLQETME